MFFDFPEYLCNEKFDFAIGKRHAARSDSWICHAAIEGFYMGMSTHIVGFRHADDRWKKMKAAYEACETAGIAVPNDIEEFFGYEPPGDKPGIEVEIKDSEAVSKWSDKSRSGYEIDVTKLPKDIAVIRVYNSW